MIQTEFNHNVIWVELQADTDSSDMDQEPVLERSTAIARLPTSLVKEVAPVIVEETLKEVKSLSKSPTQMPDSYSYDRADGISTDSESESDEKLSSAPTFAVKAEPSIKAEAAKPFKDTDEDKRDIRRLDT
jgi:hypothetical protein